MEIIASNHKIEYSIKYNGELYHAEITINEEDSTWIEAFVLQDGEPIEDTLEKQILEELDKLV